MTTGLEKNTVLCLHCGAEPIDDDDLCRFCGKVMLSVGSVKSAFTVVSSGLRSLKRKIKPMTAEELKEDYEPAPLDLSDPSDPIWDD